MIKNTNISTSAVKVFQILRKLNISPCSKEELLDGFSDDTLTFYINTLRQSGYKISSPKRTIKHYKLISSPNYFNLDNEDIELLLYIKSFLAQYNSYKNIINFNNLILKFAEKSNGELKNKFETIIDSAPFGTNLHKIIYEMENYIKSKTPLIINYISPNSDENFYHILPLYLKMQNSKLYLWGHDNSLSELRCLKLNRIKNFKVSDKKFVFIEHNNTAICKFAFNDVELLDIFEKYEIIEKNNNYIIAKITFYNTFEFLQKTLYLAHECEIIEPIALKNKLQEKIKLIKEKYAK